MVISREALWSGLGEECGSRAQREAHSGGIQIFKWKKNLTFTHLLTFSCTLIAGSPLDLCSDQMSKWALTAGIKCQKMNFFSPCQEFASRRRFFSIFYWKIGDISDRNRPDIGARFSLKKSRFLGNSWYM